MESTRKRTASSRIAADDHAKGEAAVAVLVPRVRCEFLEMPGLRLTVAQAARLWALDQTTSAQILSMLTTTGFLWRNPTGAYVRVSVG
jgi:hypothetical protein